MGSKFGTTLEQIEQLRTNLLEFVTKENREYQSTILTELTTLYECYSITLNVVFFYKSNWQNELLRLQVCPTLWRACLLYINLSILTIM